MLTKMNPEVKQKWIHALRSGKYQQGSEKLRSVSGYCCLGVLCDLYSQEHDVEWEFRGNSETNLQLQDYWYFDDQSEFLPKVVMNWAGLKTNNPQVQIEVEDSFGDNWYCLDEIANVNDSGYTFTQLSNLIEEYL
jgi:hypothetical protein